MKKAKREGFTGEEIDAIMAAYRKGATLKSIAEAVERSVTDVEKYLRRRLGVKFGGLNGNS